MLLTWMSQLLRCPCLKVGGYLLGKNYLKFEDIEIGKVCDGVKRSIFLRTFQLYKLEVGVIACKEL